MKKEKCKFCGRKGELRSVTINHEGITFEKHMCEACAKWCSSGDVIIFQDVEEMLMEEGCLTLFPGVEEILKWDADTRDSIPSKGEDDEDEK